MTTYNNYQEDIIAVSGGTVIKKRNSRVAIFSFMILLVSVLILLTVIRTGIHTTSGVSALAFGMIGTVISLTTLLSTNRYYFAPTGSEVDIKRLYFEPKDQHIVNAIIEKGNFEDLDGLGKVKSSPVMVEMWISRDDKFAAVQMFSHRKKKFFAVTPIIYVSSPKVTYVSEYAYGN